MKPTSHIPATFRSLMDSIGLGDVPEALEMDAPTVSVRLNRAKGGAVFEGGTRVAWCEDGLILPERPSFTLDPRLHQGLYYVQEAASMFHSWLVRAIVPSGSRGLRVLDACAAPGGKTTAVMGALPAGSVTVANEYVPARAAILRENIVKWGVPDVIVTRADTASLRRLGETFDLIVADVPCSGEGMMRKDPRAAAQWSEGLVRECASLQREIVANLWDTLNPGGWLIYSTCTFNRTEDEENVEWMINELGAESVRVEPDPAWGITPGLATEACCHRFIPGRTPGEGLFAAVVRKPGTLPATLPEPKATGKRREKTPAVPAEVRAWVVNPGEMTITATADRITAFPAAHMGLLRRVGERVDVIHEGVPLATVKGRDLVPTHALALSTAFNGEAFPHAELTAEMALSYLRGEALSLPEGTPRGYVAVTYGGRPLGWVKHLGNRSNNLYPQPFRIKNL